MTLPPMPQLTNWISFGNLLTLIVMTLGGAGVFFKLQSEAGINTRDISEVKVELKRTQEEVRSLQLSQVLYDERTNTILGLLEKIDKRLERIEGQP